MKIPSVVNIFRAICCTIAAIAGGSMYQPYTEMNKLSFSIILAGALVAFGITFVNRTK